MTAPSEVPLSPPRPVTPAGIVADELARLVRLAASTPGTDPALLAGLHEVCELAGGLEEYVSRWSSPESGELRALEARTRGHDWSGRGEGLVRLEQEMLSGHVEGQLLKMLVHATRATNVLEIGMFTGYSALAMAEALPASGRVVACELDAAVAAFARGCFAASLAGPRIDVRVGPAQDTLQVLASAGEVFDLVFLDADKPGYGGYLDTLLARDLVARHGLICVDNTLMQGEPWTSAPPSVNGAAIAQFNRVLAEDPRVEQVVVPLRDGFTIIRQSS